MEQLVQDVDCYYTYKTLNLELPCKICFDTTKTKQIFALASNLDIQFVSI